MKTLRHIAVSFIAIVLFYSCDKPEPDPIPSEPDAPEVPEVPVEPEKPVSPEPNTFVINGESYDFESVSATMTGENVSIAASPQPGYSDVVDMMTDAEEYMYVGISPILVGKEFDLMTEQNLYTVYSTLADCFIEILAPGETSEITSGKCLVTVEDNTVTLAADIELKDGTSLKALIVTDNIETPIVINENEIGRNDEIKPLRTAFYLEKGNLTYLYFTPANISYFSELSIATWYLYMVVPTNLIKGKDISMDELDPSCSFVFGMVDNVTPEQSVEVAGDSLKNLTGTINISNSELGSYLVKCELFLNGNVFRIWFDGPCISAKNEKPEEKKDNKFKYKKETFDILSASLSKGEEVWMLTLDMDNGKSAEITMSKNLFQKGGVFGFSQDKNMAVAYDGNVFSKANGFSGTLTMRLDETAGIVETEFTNYNGCEFYYFGEYELN